MLTQNRREQRPVYSFPELRNAEILQCLEDLRIPVTEADLTRPTPPVVQKIYEAFAEIFFGGAINTNNNPAVAEILEYPELHVESIGLISFFRSISRLMVEVGIDDFSFKDLIRPEGPRLRIILSAIINFAKFREEQLSVFEDFNRKSDELVEQRNKLAARESELSGKISYFKQRRIDEEPSLIKAKEQISSMINELRDFKKEQAALTNELEQLKFKKSEYSDKLNQTNFLLSNVKQECNKIKSRIVHSPEKLMQIITEMNASIQSERTNLAQLEKKSRELQMKLDALTQIETDTTRALNLLEQNDEIVRKRDSLIIQLQDDKETINKKNVYIKDLELKEQQCRRQLTVSQEKYSKLLQQQDQRRAQIENQLTTLRQDYNTLSEERSRLVNKMDQTDKMIKDMESKLFELKRSHDNEMFNLRADCLNLKTQVSHYLNEVKKSL